MTRTPRRNPINHWTGSAWSCSPDDDTPYVRTLDRVLLIASGPSGNNHALYNTGSNLTVTDSELEVRIGYGDNTGLVNLGDHATLTNVSIAASGSGYLWGVENSGDDFTMSRSNIQTSGSGATVCRGIESEADAEPLTVEYSTIDTTMCINASMKTGVEINGADATLRDVVIRGKDGVRLIHGSIFPASIELINLDVVSTGKGVYLFNTGSGSCHVTIEGGRYNSGTDAVGNPSNPGCTVDIGGVFLANGVSGSATCAGVFDQNYVFYPNTCPP